MLVHELFETQAARTPQAIAASSRDKRLTYFELNERSNRLAWHLRSRGIGPEDRVAVLLPRSVDLVVALLAVLKTGAAYVPIDPDYPAERTAFMTRDANPAMILDRLPETDHLSTANLTDADRSTPLNEAHACYVVYTSGSTGRPKGVVVEHRSFAAHVRRSAAHYPGIPGTSLVHTSVGFDLTVTALYPQLVTGGCVWLGGLTADDVRDAPRPTFLKATPSHLGMLLDTLPTSVSPSECLMLGGESLEGASIEAWRSRHPDVTVYNSYGPAETTVNCCDFELPPGVATPTGSVPIGRPFPGTTAVYLLDERLQPVPPGTVGELYVTGSGLARGYLLQPGLTATRFIADPFGRPGARMYRTGDLARLTDQGMFEFVGRSDDQLSVRGFRIEPGEIEGVVRERTEIRQAAVTLQEFGPDDKRIVCYVVPENGVRIEPSTLRREVGMILPEYMVPSAFVALECMPLSSNGKLDRASLPAFEPTGTSRRRAPHSSAEHVLCDAFAEVLGVEQVDPDDSFFELGGHSLLAIRLINLVKAALCVRLDIRDLFELQTPAALAGKLAQTGDAGHPPLRPLPRPASIPLSYAQERLWFLQRLDGPNAAYNIPYVQRVIGALDVQALDAALSTVTRRHEILRTSYPEVDGQATQHVHPPSAGTPTLMVQDTDEAGLSERVRRLAILPFDLREEIPVRATLFRITPTEHVLAIIIHHIACDGWPLGPLARDLAHAYYAHLHHSPVELPHLPVQYIDYSLWQRGLESHDRQLDHWLTTLADLPEELPLPYDHPRPPTPTHRGGQVPIRIPAETHRRLAELARAEGATTFMSCHTALTVLISKLTGHIDIPIGTPVTGRTDQSLDDLVGFFVNLLVLRTVITGNPTFRELLSQTRHTDLTALAHQTTPFDHIVEQLNPQRTANRTPLFQIMMTAQPMYTPLELPGLTVSPLDQVPRMSKFDLNLNFDEQFTADGQPAGIAGYIEFDRDLFEPATAQNLSRWLTSVFVTAAEDPELRLSEFDLLTAGEREQILIDWNDTARDHPQLSLPALLEAQVRRTPEATAVQAGDLTLSYAELNTLTNRLARHLISCGAGPESLVALRMPRSADAVVAVWAVLKAGAAYLPIDPEYPRQRIAFMLTDADPAIVLTELPEVEGLPGHDLDDAERLASLQPGHPCLIVYTSGSTGRPKGVTLPCGALTNLVSWWTEQDPPGRAAQFAALSFDVAALEILATTIGGGRLIVPDEKTRKDPDGFVDWLLAYAVDDLMCLPNLMLEEISEAIGRRSTRIPALRRIGQGGEALVISDQLRDLFRRNPGLRLDNCYGPSETHVTTRSTLPATVEDWPQEAPIGRPMANTRVYVLDRWLRPVQTGLVGELYIAGAQLARGYLNRPALTGSRFIANPFDEPGSRMYRTGDLVRWRTDGELLFVGRIDHQVKVRGFRIEPGEIEDALRRHPGVSQAAVLPVGDQTASRMLVAYLVPDGDSTPTPEALRTHLRRDLPEYMVPSAFVVLDRMPLSPNGKLDRHALPAPAAQAPGRQAVTAVERTLCRIYADVLRRPEVRVNDDFFELGGHSLTATRIVSRIRAQLEIDLPLRELFERRTPARLAETLETAARSGTPLRARPRPTEIPLSFAQERLWFLHRLEGPSPTYNLPIAQRMTGLFNVEAFAEALTDVVRRHESLRTVFPEVNGTPVQRVVPADRANVPLTTESADGERLATRLSETVARPFDLENDIPLRVTLFQVTPTEHVLVLVIHHIACDGWSHKALAEDLSAAYAARCDGAAPVWAPLPVQYADYALWQRETLDGIGDEDGPARSRLRFWADALANLPDEIGLPFDRPRPVAASFQGGSVELKVSTELHRQLADLARRSGTTTFMVFHAALAILLTRLSDNADIPIGIPVAGRDDEALNGLIGFFVNTVVLRADLSGDPTFAELLGRIRETDLAAFAHQDIPFEQLVRELNPARGAGRHPLFQVMMPFNSNLASTIIELPRLTVRREPYQLNVAKFDLSFVLREALGPDNQARGVVGAIEYSTDLFDRVTVLAIAARLHRILEAVADDADRPVSRIDVLAVQERRNLLTDWNGARVEPPTEFAHALIEMQATRVPDAAAVVCGDKVLGYRTLNEKANQLARYLIAHGVGTEDRVAIVLDRSVDLVVAMIAVLKSGGAYVPIDPDYPPERISYMVADSDCRLVLSEPVDTDSYGASNITDEERLRPLNLTDTAYMIYTSGSTGRPKGVLIEHRAMAAYLSFLGTAYPGVPGLSLVHTSISFDLTITALYGQLTTGGTARLGALDGDGPQPTFLKSTPSHLELMLALPDNASPSECLVIGGETLNGRALGAWRERHPDVCVVNAYGPTESAVNCSEFHLARGEPTPAGVVPIGRPFPGVRLYVLDRRLHLAPIGVAGEIYIAGLQLARGYFSQAALTATRFIADPYGDPGTRMYRTGDIARWLPSGMLDFIGRADGQVKVRGYRIELGEIEGALREQPDVAQAVAAVHDYGEGDQRLVGYVVPEPGTSIDLGIVQQRLARILPDYMLPSVVLELDALPLTPNGKLDRAALPAPDFASSDEHRAPRTYREQMLCDLFAEVLGTGQVGVDDSFFALGGHSLLVIRLMGRIETTVGVKANIRDLFDAPTPAGLAAKLGTAGSSDPLAPLLPLRTGEGDPLFCIHPGAGIGWVYSGLLRHLDSDVPVYALQAPALNAPDAAPRSIDDLAGDYVRRIRARQPKGPYKLLGWSLGGLIAHLVAVRLQEEGQQIALLALLDSYPRQRDTRRQDVVETDPLRELAGSLGQEVTPDGSLSGLADLRTSLLVNVFVEHRRLFAEVSLGVFHGDVLLFTATADKPADSPYRPDAWREHVTGHIEVVPVDCAHGEMTRPRALSVIAPITADRLRKPPARPKHR